MRNDLGRLDGEAERDLLLDLAAGWEAFGEDQDSPLFAGVVAAAFWNYGIDLEHTDPEFVGKVLGNRASTAVIASQIDYWSFMRRSDS